MQPGEVTPFFSEGEGDDDLARPRRPRAMRTHCAMAQTYWPLQPLAKKASSVLAC